MAKNALLYIHCLTGLHPGSGTALGVVDLPVKRERHTEWPTVPGSSLKGVLRAACASERGRHDERVLAAFGPEPGAASDHAGALALADARLLAFPVRSLRGIFAWTTCPAALERLNRDLGLIGVTDFPEIPTVVSNRLVCAANSPLLTNEHAVLEEFEFAREKDRGAGARVAAWLASRVTTDPHMQERFQSHLAILSDDDFTHFARHTTDIVARIGLDYERKTVRKGALFYEEYLPAETLFYSLVMGVRSRRSSVRMSAAGILGWFGDAMPRHVQIGGGESIGKGLCALQLVSDNRGVVS